MSETAEQPAAAPAETTARAQAIEALVDAWEFDCIHNAPPSRDTAGFNHLHNHAVPELKRRLLKELT